MVRKAARTHPLNDPLSRKVFAMLQAYMDDSGSHEGAHNCVVAGYWGGVKEWRFFEWQWGEVLRSEGIEEFKANEFWPRPKGVRLGPYKSWTDERHKRFIDRLLTIIESRNITPFASGFVGAEWDKLPVFLQRMFSGAREDTQQIKPLIMPLLLCVTTAVKYCKPGKTMHFVMDSDPRIAGRAAQTFAELKRYAIAEDGPIYTSLGGLTFEDSRSAVPLQAADLLAYEAHRYAKRANGDRNFPVRREYQRALAHIKSIDDFHLYDAPRMAKLRRWLAEHSQGSGPVTESTG